MSTSERAIMIGDEGDSVCGCILWGKGGENGMMGRDCTV